MLVSEEYDLGKFDIKSITEKLGIKDADNIIDMAKQAWDTIRKVRDGKEEREPAPVILRPPPAVPRRLAPVEKEKPPPTNYVPYIVAGGGVLLLLGVILLAK